MPKNALTAIKKVFHEDLAPNFKTRCQEGLKVQWNIPPISEFRILTDEMEIFIEYQDGKVRILVINQRRFNSTICEFGSLGYDEAEQIMMKVKDILFGLVYEALDVDRVTEEFRKAFPKHKILKW